MRERDLVAIEVPVTEVESRAVTPPPCLVDHQPELAICPAPPRETSS